MKFKIIVDSSSNLTNDYIKDENIGFEVVPLTIRVNEKEYVDNDSLKVEELLSAIEDPNVIGRTSCPSPNDFFKAFEGYDRIFIVTISGKLSGCYNSALVAKDMAEKGTKVAVIDSKLVCGAMRVIVDKAYELIKEGKDFETIEKELVKTRDENNLLFVLDKFDNLVKNGRMSKVVAFIASMIAIKPLCYGEDGEIKIKEKIRTFHGVLKRLVVNIGKMCPNTKGRKCIISHTLAEKDALFLKKEIINAYEFDEVIVENNRGLSAFYALKGGIIVSF